MNREDERRITDRERASADAADAAVEAAGNADAESIAGEHGQAAGDVKQPWDRLEHALAEQLTGGPLEEDPDRERKLRGRISPRYEIRIQTELDPIVEETKQYRKLAKEIDGRYDRFDS